MPKVNWYLLAAVVILVLCSLLQRARLSLRYCGHRHDGGDGNSRLPHPAPLLALAPVECRPGDQPFLMIDLIFLSANLLKVHEGGGCRWSSRGC